MPFEGTGDRGQGIGDRDPDPFLFPSTAWLKSVDSARIASPWGEEDAMPGPKLPAVEVTVEERAELERIVRRHTAGQQLVERARIVDLKSVVKGRLVCIACDSVIVKSLKI